MLTRKQQRQVKRAIKAVKYAVANRNGGGEKEKARRIDQMLREVARAENGVVINYAEEQNDAQLCSKPVDLSEVQPAEGQGLDPLLAVPSR